MRHPHQQPLPLETVNRLAQGSTANAISASQLRFGNFAARSYPSGNNRRLYGTEHLLRQSVPFSGCAFDSFSGVLQHFVNIQPFNRPRSYAKPPILSTPPPTLLTILQPRSYILTFISSHSLQRRNPLLIMWSTQAERRVTPLSTKAQ